METLATTSPSCCGPGSGGVGGDVGASASRGPRGFVDGVARRVVGLQVLEMRILLFVFPLLIATSSPSHAQAPHRSVGADSLVDRRSIERAADSTSHRRATIAGGIVGAVAGGLGAAGYILNATASKCTTFGPPCPNDPHTTRRVVVITVGTGAGAALGAWVARKIAYVL